MTLLLLLNFWRERASFYVARSDEMQVGEYSWMCARVCVCVCVCVCWVAAILLDVVDGWEGRPWMLWRVPSPSKER